MKRWILLWIKHTNPWPVKNKVKQKYFTGPYFIIDTPTLHKEQ